MNIQSFCKTLCNRIGYDYTCYSNLNNKNVIIINRINQTDYDAFLPAFFITWITSSLKTNKHQNKHLQASWNKYGADAFLFEVVEVVDGDKAARTTREQELINEQLDNWKHCFNFKKKTVKKQGPWSSTPEETRKKLCKAMKEFLWLPDNSLQVSHLKY